MMRMRKLKFWSVDPKRLAAFAKCATVPELPEVILWQGFLSGPASGGACSRLLWYLLRRKKRECEKEIFAISSFYLEGLTDGAIWLSGQRFGGGESTEDIRAWIEGLNL